MSSSSFSQFPTLKVFLPPISKLLLSKDVFYHTYCICNPGFPFPCFFSLLLKILFFGLPKLAFWTLFRAKLLLQLCGSTIPSIPNENTLDLFHMFNICVINVYKCLVEHNTHYYTSYVTSSDWFDFSVLETCVLGHK